MNTNSINVNKYAISKMFDSESKEIYEIPKYQREYIWAGREWEALFDDLTENEEGHFLGSIICIITTNDTLSPRLEVVDGQQRLTTLSILFAALYKALNDYTNALDEEQRADVLQLKRKLVLKNTDSGIRVVPQIQGKAKSGKEKANPIIAGTSGATQKVWHEKPISNVHGIIDTDLARDNLENDLPFADLQDL